MNRRFLTTMFIVLFMFVVVISISLAQSDKTGGVADIPTASVAADTAEVVVSDSRADDFAILNGFIFYVQNCKGDAGVYETNIKRQVRLIRDLESLKHGEKIDVHHSRRTRCKLN